MITHEKKKRYNTGNDLDIESLPEGVSQFYFKISTDGLGKPISIPIIVIKGLEDGPTVGITAAVHGNELNGINVIHELIKIIDFTQMHGTLIAIPVINIPGYHSNRREYAMGDDLNRVMPGKIDGTPAQIYAYRIINWIIRKFDFLLDLHTASFGRINTHYVRADMTRQDTARIALLCHPQIILHAPGPAKGLRNAAVQELGIPAVTIEVGDPQRFQTPLIITTINGILTFLNYLGSYPYHKKPDHAEPVICKKSMWIRAGVGGVMKVFPKLADKVFKNQPIAEISDIFGNVIATMLSPSDGIVIGRSTNPVSVTGSRILHLGIIGEDENFATLSEDEEHYIDDSES